MNRFAKDPKIDETYVITPTVWFCVSQLLKDTEIVLFRNQMTLTLIITAWRLHLISFLILGMDLAPQNTYIQTLKM